MEPGRGALRHRMGCAEEIGIVSGLENGGRCFTRVAAIGLRICQYGILPPHSVCLR